MHLAEKIFIIVSVLELISKLFDKWAYWDKIELYFLSFSNITKVKFFYSLAFCVFCQKFWMCFILSFFVSIVSGPSLKDLALPIIAYGFYNLIKNR